MRNHGMWSEITKTFFHLFFLEIDDSSWGEAIGQNCAWNNTVQLLINKIMPVIRTRIMAMFCNLCDIFNNIELDLDLEHGLRLLSAMVIINYMNRKIVLTLIVSMRWLKKKCSAINNDWTKWLINNTILYSKSVWLNTKSSKLDCKDCVLTI